MPVNRFWGSVWGAAAYLLGVGLLQYVVMQIATLFGVAPVAWVGTISLLVAAVVPIAGTFVYIDWKWGWGPQHIGLGRRPAAVGWTVIGLVLGLLAAFAVHLASGLLSGDDLSQAIGAVKVLNPNPISLGLILVFSFGVEMVFRGGVISRYQADLSPREILLAGVLTPFAWILVGQLLGFPAPDTGIDNGWTAAMSIFLSLLFLRTDSVWVSTGLRAGMIGAGLVFTLQATEKGGLAVWGTAAVVLLVAEWFRLQRTPRRIQPTGRPQRFNRGSRTIRGPWGPH